MRSVSFNELASAELAEAAQYYERESTGLGEAFLASVEDAVARLVDFPESSPLVRRDLRRMVLRRFPFSLIYRVRESDVRVLAVAHQRRRPAYWFGRA